MSSSGAFSVILIVFFLAGASARRDTPAGDRRSSSDEEGLIRSMAGYGEEKLSTVVVAGNLLCSVCSPRGPQLLPISGALVEVTCKSNSHYKSRIKKPTLTKGTTGENGEFIIELPSAIHAIPGLDKACSVKVLRLPKHPPCRSALNFAKHEAHPIFLSHVGNGIRTYTAGTIHFLNGDFENRNLGCKRKESHGSF